MSTRILFKQRRKNIAIAISLGAIAIALGMVLSLGGIGVLPPRDLRILARSIILNTYNPWNITLTSYSLNAVSAIIWDYRGIDTIFETAVLLSAVTGISIIFHEALEIKGLRRRGMSIIAKTSTRLIVLLTILIAISTTVHGHLTPGGGFQGGSIVTVSIALLVIVFSIESLYDIGFRKTILLKIRYAILILMFLVALVPLTFIIMDNTVFIMQNQLKKGSRFSMPSKLFNTPLAGSIYIFNLLECLATAFALSYILLLLTKRREELKTLIEDEEY